MTGNILEKFFEHNNWANEQIIRACARLSAEQLDAEPTSATKGSIRVTLTHLVGQQQHYLALLTVPVEERRDSVPAFEDLLDVARTSGEGLLALAKDMDGKFPKDRLQTTDGYYADPWVVMLQVINHATEHREQINSMLTALGETPMDQDGWTFGEVTGALVPILK
ncbi:MAG: hypothetical protein M1281_00930 [Chloroflexi bacterium]|nr:hypothetical protein [Chloroflexota bacterium]